METAFKELMFEFYKRTATEFEFWLRDNYEYILQKEKEQIIEAYKEGCFDNILDETADTIRAKNYYNQTYNQIK